MDHYHRYKEDVALFDEMGFKVYRFSMSPLVSPKHTSFSEYIPPCIWARIFPNADDPAPNEEGLIFYENLLKELILPYALLTEEGKIIWMNRRFMEITGKGREYSRNISTITHKPPQKLP